MGEIGGDSILWQWIIVIVFGFLMIVLSPRARNVKQFFQARVSGKSPGILLLSSSLVISWIFAKSITNAANLGMEHGLIGGLAYSAYYLSFLVAGLILVNMRISGSFGSIHDFLRTKFGRRSLLIFSVLISIRLFNEVWSNTMIIGSYFGEWGTNAYFSAIILFTLLTLIYALKGGLRSSLFTDAIQLMLFGVILFVILNLLLPDIPINQKSLGSWNSGGGINLLWVALIQIFSYPFHDPVLTDRAFISDPKTTRISFIIATLAGCVFVLLFSLVGVYARTEGLQGEQAPVLVNKSMGVAMMLLMNTIMITSASSTLDSSLASFSKLAIIDWKRKVSIGNGRLAMIIICILGTLPVFWNPSILSATTISGTMVIGLAPVFIFWKIPAPPASFILSVGSGLFWGVWLAFGELPEWLNLFNGPYSDLLTVNIFGTINAFLFYFFPIIIKRLYAKSGTA